MKNDMKPSLTPCFLVNASCIFARRAMTPLMSHSLKVVRMAAVCCAMTSWAAILRRRGVSFLRVVRPASARLGDRRGGGGAAFPARPAAGAAGRFSTKPSTSPLVARPPLPVPVISAGETCSSSINRRTAGESGRSAAGLAVAGCACGRGEVLRLGLGGGQRGGFGRGGELVRRGVGSGGRGGAFLDERDDLADLDLLALLGLDGQTPAAGGDDLAGNLVGFEGQQRFVGLHGVAVFLVPRGDDAGGDGFADGGDFDFEAHAGRKQVN